jgi:hypothetical protein
MGMFNPLEDATEEETTFFKEDEANQEDIEKEISEEVRSRKEKVEEAEDVDETEEVEEKEEETEEETEDEHESKHVPLQELLKERKWRQDIGRQLEAERKRFETANERLQRLYEAMDQRGKQQQHPHLQQPEQRETAQLPDRTKDPLGYLMAKIEHMEQTASQREQERMRAEEERRQEEESYNKQQEQVHRFQNDLMNAEEQFRSVTPDYDDAFDYLTNQRRQELATLGYNPQQREQIIVQEATQVAANLLSQGQNPAERFYHFAKQRGYGQRTEQPKANKVQHLAETHKKTKAPGRGKASNAGKPTIEALSDMSDDEFDKWFEVLYKET